MINNDKRLLIEIITKYLPHTKIYLFGSRARGDFTPESDIDLALDNGEKINSTVLSEIKETIEETLIPFTVDIVDMHNITQDFKNQILKDRKLWH